MNCSQLFAHYMANGSFASMTSRESQYRCGQKAVKHFAEHLPCRITPALISGYIELRRSQNRKDGTIKRELGAFRASLSFAAAVGLISPDDIPMIPKLRDNTRRLVYMTAEQKRVFVEKLSEAPLHIRGFGMIGLVFGARAGAIEDLSPDRVGDYVEFRMYAAQTRKRRSINKVPQEMRPLMAALKLASSGNRLLPMRSARAFSRWCAKQEWPDKFPNITPHVLRHTCATLMLERGATIWEVSQWLNETTSTIERYYGHFTAASQDRLANLVMQ